MVNVHNAQKVVHTGLPLWSHEKRRRLKAANEEKGHNFELDGRCRALVRRAGSREGTKGSTLRMARNSAAWGRHLG